MSDRQAAEALLDGYGVGKYTLPPVGPECQWWSAAMRPGGRLNAYLTAMGWLRDEGWHIYHLEASTITERGETVPTVVVVHVLTGETNQ